MTIPVCACGTPKQPAGNFFRCEHCDGVCAKRDGCQRCATFSFNTNRRLNG